MPFDSSRMGIIALCEINQCNAVKLFFSSVDLNRIGVYTIFSRWVDILYYDITHKKTYRAGPFSFGKVDEFLTKQRKVEIDIKAYIPPERKIPGVGGWRWAMPPTPEFCVGDTNMLVSTQRQTPDAKPKICVSPNAKPQRQPVEYRWRWVFWRWPCIFHVYFMYISCCLCIIFRIGYARLADAKADSSGIWA